LTGEDEGGGDEIISILNFSYFPLPFIPSRQGRGKEVSGWRLTNSNNELQIFK
jgi:hypothetical protein